MYTVTSNYEAFDQNVAVYTNNKKNSGYSIFYKKKCIPLHHGQSFVKKCNGIHFIYTIIVLLELLEIVLHFLNILFSV